MNIRQYVVDAFTDRVFSGNPAAVCIMEKWLPEEAMMDIAMENNLSETAFAVEEGDGYRLRWFTPGGEVDLCGHATLAAAYVVSGFYRKNAARVVFSTMSGPISVERRGDLFELELPAYKLSPVPVTEEMCAAMGAVPGEAYMGRDMLCVFDSPEEIINMRPEMEKVERLEGAMLHVTARGREIDCVSRSFAPKFKVSEDPVCGSGHCHIVPYWAGVLGKNELTAYQASRRGGTLYCRAAGKKVFLAGKAALFSRGELYIQ